MKLLEESRYTALWGACAIAASSLVSPVSLAVVIQPGGDGSGSSLGDLFDSITVSSPNPGNTSSIDVQSDQLSDQEDSLWTIKASESAATIVIELAGFANTNTFGVYDASDASNRVELFDGAASTASRTVLSISTNGSVWVDWVDTGIDFAANSFGYYLDSSTRKRGGLFFSETALNADEEDHMVAYQGKGTDTIKIGSHDEKLWDVDEYALAWEDLHGGGDHDYQDFVVMVDSVFPVPVPATVWLFGSGLLGLIGVIRRKKTA